MKEDLFKSDLEELFCIAIKDAMTEIKNEEDWEFLCMQKQDVFSCSMSGVDLKTTAKECRKRQRLDKEYMVKVRCAERETKCKNEDSSEISWLSSDESEEDY